MPRTTAIRKRIQPTEKPEINDNSPKDVIECNGRVFEVPTEMIEHLALLPDNLAARIDRAVQNGMRFMYDDGGFGCHHCNHYALDVGQEAMRTGTTIHYQVDERKCRYKQNGVKWAGRFYDKQTGAAVMAQKKPCVVLDSLIKELVGRGLLDQYEVQRKFDFPTLSELKENPELVDTYQVPSN